MVQGGRAVWLEGGRMAAAAAEQMQQAALMVESEEPIVLMPQVAMVQPEQGVVPMGHPELPELVVVVVVITGGDQIVTGARVEDGTLHMVQVVVVVVVPTFRPGPLVIVGDSMAAAAAEVQAETLRTVAQGRRASLLLRILLLLLLRAPLDCSK